MNEACGSDEYMYAIYWPFCIYSLERSVGIRWKRDLFVLVGGVGEC